MEDDETYALHISSMSAIIALSDPCGVLILQCVFVQLLVANKDAGTVIGRSGGVYFARVRSAGLESFGPHLLGYVV